MKKFAVIFFGCLCFVPLLLCAVYAVGIGALPVKYWIQAAAFAAIGGVFVSFGSRYKTEKKAKIAATVVSSDCPYPRDSSKPLGSKDNPMVVGMPEYSTTLVYDGKNQRWILTDGLGNGWIR